MYERGPQGHRGFDAFFESEYPAIVRTVTHIVRDREVAREIAQDAFIKAYAKWWRISRYDKPGAWVRRVAIRMAVKAERRRRLVENALQRHGPEVAVDAGVDDDVLDALKRLSPRQRAAIALFYLEDHSVAEIADILECSDSTVKVHLHKGRSALRVLLGGRADD